MDKPENNNFKGRMRFVQVVLVAFILVLAAKSFDIQIFQAKELQAKARQDYARLLTVKGERGQVFDRRMNKLATSIDAISVSACPAKIQNPKKTASQLAKILGTNRKKLQDKLSTGRMFTWVARSISPTEASQIRNLKINGIYFEDDFKRFYPQRNLAAQVIGFTNAEDIGLEGLEFKYNSILEGDTLKVRVIRDGNGQILDLNKNRRAQLQGKSIVLTLDKKIQYLSERILENTVKVHKAKSGLALVMNPNTGELLSIAHYPQFNPNNFSEYDRFSFRNRAVTDSFEPGSAMKVFTAAAALEKGFAPKQIFFCENGSYRIGHHIIRDTHSHGWLTINQIIKFSSNIGAVKIVETIGDKSLYDYLTGFGFGRKTLVGCPGETMGMLTPYQKWSRIDAGAISFGQGVSVSAVQLISGISAIANGGTLMKPILIKKIIDNAGHEVKNFTPEPVRRVISPKTAQQIARMMNSVVSEDGTGTNAALDGFEVCGKTGTAQKAAKDKKGYAKNKYTSVFAGFAPKDDPKLAILVVVDEPQNQYYGGEVAAPAFRDILAESFNYLNIRPKEDKSMIAMVSHGEKKIEN